MNVQPICWEYRGNTKCLWLGKTNGMLSHIELYISATNNIDDEYRISANIYGFTSQAAIGIENAKSKAQELLNSYALSIIIP